MGIGGRSGFMGFRPEDRRAQPPCVGMARMSHPGLDAPCGFLERHGPCPPLIVIAPQPVAEPPHIVLRKTPPTWRLQHEAEKLRGFARSHNECLARV